MSFLTGRLELLLSGSMVSLGCPEFSVAPFFVDPDVLKDERSVGPVRVVTVGVWMSASEFKGSRFGS
jgi:hypothetical protein